MNKLGISLYPDISDDLIKDKEYLELARKYGFKRLFMCLLNIDVEKKEFTFQRFTTLCQFAKQLGYEIFIDVSPEIMKELRFSYDDLKEFEKIGTSGIRLDESFNGEIEAKMTNNPYNLKIELNASVDDQSINHIFKHNPNMNNLTTCHNYYPLRYTGLSINHFIQTTINLKSYGLRVATFISSQEEDTFGPWDVNEGLCTLEIHRDLPIDIQIKHLLAMNLVDDMIIANAYASENELKKCQQALLHPHELQYYTNENSIIEEKIIEEKHELRKDRSDYVVRSTLPRIKYKKYRIYEQREIEDIKRGDIIIINDKMKRYKGELQIALKNLDNDGRMNVVGKIIEEEHILLDYINTWDEVTFIQKENT